MATLDEILGEVSQLTLGVKRGAINPDRLTPKGQLGLRIGRGEADLDNLSPQDRALIGLDPTLMQRVGDAARSVMQTGPGQNFFGVREPKHTGFPSTTFLDPLKHAATGPTVTETIASGLPQAPGPLNLAAKMVSPIERAMNIAFSPLVGGAHLVEQGIEHLPRIVGQPPASTPVSRVAGALAEGFGMVLPGLKKVPFTKERTVQQPPVTITSDLPLVARDAVNVPADLSGFQFPAPHTGAAPGSPSVAGAGRELVSTRQVLRPERIPGPPGQLALPPAVDVPPPQSALTGAVVGDRKALQDYRLGERPPAQKALPPGAYEAPGEVMPTPTKRPYRDDAPVDVTAEAPPAGKLLDAQGRPIPAVPREPTMSERDRLRALGRTPLNVFRETMPRSVEDLPAVPEGPLPSAFEAGSARRGQPPPEPPPAAPAVEPPKPPDLPPVSDLKPPPAGKFEPPDKGGRQGRMVNEVLDTTDPDDVRAYLKDRGGVGQSDHEGIPVWARKKGGQALDKHAANIAAATGRDAKQVEKELARTLQQYDRLRAAKKSRGAVEEFPTAGSSVEGPPPDVARLFNPGEWDGMPADQRAAAVTFLRGEMAGSEGGPKLGGFLPPIPLPGPDEDEEDSTKRALMRTGQILGLSLPLLGVLVGGARGTITSASPRLARHLDRAPHEISVERALMDDPMTMGATSRNAIGDLVRKIFGQSPSISIDLAPGAGARTAVHEGLHASYFAKGTHGFPPVKYLQQLYSHFIGKYPQLAARGQEEAVIDAMAREVVRRGRLPLPAEAVEGGQSLAVGRPGPEIAFDRRPKQQGLGLEGSGPQKGLFDQPLPEVPSTAGLAARLAPARFQGMQERLSGEPIELWNLTEDIPGHPRGSTVSRQTLEAKGFEVPPPSVSGYSSVVLYRGVAAGRDPRSLEGTIGGLTYTKDKNAARYYAGTHGTVIRERVDFTNLLMTDNWMAAKRQLGLPQSATMQDIVVAARDAGHDGVAFNGAHGVEYIRLSPVPTPRFEKTPLGEQAVIPGTPPREMPKAPLSADVPQRDITETPLFGQERAAGERASDAAQGALDLPPVPEPPTAMRWQQMKPRAGTLDGYRSADGRFVVEQRTPDEWIAMDRQAGTQETFPTFHAARQWAAKPQGALPEVPSNPFTSERGVWSPFKKVGGKDEPPPIVGSRPPEVPRQYRTERVGPPPKPEGEVQPPEYVAQGIRQTVDDIRAAARGEEPPVSGDIPPVSEELGARSGGVAGGGRAYEPPSGPPMPADTPGDPNLTWSRAQRFWANVKTTRPLRNMNAPEDVVASDPVAVRVVRQTYRANDNQLMLRRELEDAFERTFTKLPESDVEQIGHALDTALPGRVQYGPETMAAEAEQLRRMLSPDLAARAIAARDLIVRYTDATGLPRASRMASYFPHFRDRVKVNETTLILDPVGEPYLSQSYEVPKRMEAFFHKARTNNDPPSHFGRDAFRIFARATARHLTLNGGEHPFTGEMINGYLNDIAPQLAKVQPELRPYTGEFLNHFLGTPGARPGSDIGHQTSRIARNLQGARLLSGPGSMIANATQQGNTLALVRPTSWLRGYRDLLDPERRALAQRWIGLEELGKADLERVQQISSGLDKLEDVSAKAASVLMTGFRKVETGNRYHAFLAGLRDAEAFGLEGRPAIEYARDIVDRAQFPSMAAAKPEIARSDWGAALWQMKQFQTRQTLFIKNLIRDDVKDMVRAAKGQDVPIEIGGKAVLRPDGTPVTRDAVSLKNLPMHRTAKFLVAMTAIGGPDAIWPELDDYLREQGVQIPGLLPALGAGVASLSTYGFISPGDLTRSIMFFLPGPLIGNVQDALSAATGKNFGHGLNEFLAMNDLSYDQQVDAGVRSVPGLGVFGAKALRAVRGVQTPGEERASRTYSEAFAMEPSTGPLLRRSNPDLLDPARLGVGLQPAGKETIREERADLGEMDARAKKAVSLAADDYAAGDRAAGNARLRDAEERLKLPPGSLTVSDQAEKSATQRRGFTPLERSQFEKRKRFPERVGESRRRIPGETPDEPTERRGLGIPRVRLR